MISSVLSTKRKPVGKPNRIQKKRSIQKITLTAAIRRIFIYQQKFSGAFAVFSIGQGMSLCKIDGARFKSFKKCYPDNLIGIYDKHLTIGDLLDDLRDYFYDGVAP